MILLKTLTIMYNNAFLLKKKKKKVSWRLSGNFCNSSSLPLEGDGCPECGGCWLGAGGGGGAGEMHGKGPSTQQQGLLAESQVWWSPGPGTCDSESCHRICIEEYCIFSSKHFLNVQNGITTSHWAHALCKSSVSCCVSIISPNHPNKLNICEANFFFLSACKKEGVKA